jgi:hypothetical protein
MVNIEFDKPSNPIAPYLSRSETEFENYLHSAGKYQDLIFVEF